MMHHETQSFMNATSGETLFSITSDYTDNRETAWLHDAFACCLHCRVYLMGNGWVMAAADRTIP